jgi:TRAP-type mannitol/chloroaromatic compound transport system substrate-binding protein
MRTAVGAALIAYLGVMAAGNAPTLAGQVVAIDVVSTYPSSMPIFGDAARGLTERVQRASGGEIALTFHEPDELVPAADTIKAVAIGSVPAAMSSAAWFADQDSAFNLFSVVPFGPGVGEYLAWLYYGGGLEMARAMFHANGVHNIPCTLIPPEASGWFQKEIRSLDDLKGLRMRFFGLGANVMQKFGVVTQQLAAGDILNAMKAGKLDATEFSQPLLDRPLRFYTVAKYYYFPGWHQQATFFDLYINMARWNALEDRHKALIEIACGDTLRDTIAIGEAAQWKVMKELQAEGVLFKRWSPEILVAFEKAWYEVVAEESAKNANFKRIYDSYATFRDNYSIWRHFSYLQ